MCKGLRSYGLGIVIAVPSLSPSGSWFAEALYVSAEHTTEDTENVTAEKSVLMFPEAIWQLPLAAVVQAPEPEMPPLQLPLIVAPATRLSLASCTQTVTVPLQIFRLTLLDEPSRSPMCRIRFPPGSGVDVGVGEGDGVGVGTEPPSANTWISFSQSRWLPLLQAVVSSLT